MKINFKNIIENDFEEEIYRNYELDIIRYLKEYGKTCFWDIIKNVGGSERRMIRLLHEMVTIDEIAFDENTETFYIENEVDILNSCICDACKGKRVTIDGFNNKIKMIEEIWKQKPCPNIYIYCSRHENHWIK